MPYLPRYDGNGEPILETLEDRAAAMFAGLTEIAGSPSLTAEQLRRVARVLLKTLRPWVFRVLIQYDNAAGERHTFRSEIKFSSAPTGAPAATQAVDIVKAQLLKRDPTSVFVSSKVSRR